MRKTITIDEDLEKFINRTRAYFLFNGYDLNFTETINTMLRILILLALGYKKTKFEDNDFNKLAEIIIKAWGETQHA